MSGFVVTVDGPAASGKGVIAAHLGRAFPLPVLDTGLTGEISDIHRFATQLNIPLRKVVLDDNKYSVDPCTRLVLINPRGHYAGYMTPPFDKERMVRVLEVLRTRSS